MCAYTLTCDKEDKMCAYIWNRNQESELCVLIFGLMIKRLSCVYLHLDWCQEM